MRNILLPAAIVVALSGVATVAMADGSSDKIAAAGAMSLDQVTSRLQAQGFTIRKIKLDDGRYKVKAVDASGQKQKLYVSPQTGEVVSKSTDDD